MQYKIYFLASTRDVTIEENQEVVGNMVLDNGSQYEEKPEDDSEKFVVEEAEPVQKCSEFHTPVRMLTPKEYIMGPFFSNNNQAEY